MLAIIDIEGAGSTGRKVWIATGEKVRIGRTEEADVALPMDRALASVHFSVSCTAAECQFAGTADHELWLNGELASQGVLRTGDVLTAGGTRFTVTLEGVPSPPEAKDNDAASDASSDDASNESPSLLAVRRSSPLAGDGRAVSERAESGVYLTHIPDEEAAQRVLRRLLDASGALHAIVSNKPRDSSPELTRAPLFDWLSPRHVHASPDVLLDLTLDNPSLTIGPAAHPSTVMVASAAKGGELLEHLRLVARGQTSREDLPCPEHMLLDFAPESIAEILPIIAADFATFIFSKVTAFSWRTADGQWHMASPMKLTMPGEDEWRVAS